MSVWSPKKRLSVLLSPLIRPFRGKLAAMAFTVSYTQGDRNGRDTYDDSHTMTLTTAGALEVKQGGELVKLYSPNFWTHVTPGAPKRTASPRTSVSG